MAEDNMVWKDRFSDMERNTELNREALSNIQKDVKEIKEAMVALAVATTRLDRIETEVAALWKKRDASEKELFGGSGVLTKIRAQLASCQPECRSLRDEIGKIDIKYEERDKTSRRQLWVMIGGILTSMGFSVYNLVEILKLMQEITVSAGV